MPTLTPTFKTPVLRGLKWSLMATVLGAVTLVIGDTSAPLIALATEPLYTNGAKAKANLTLALSVEFPTVGPTHSGAFNPATVYVGYFDSAACYSYVSGAGGFNLPPGSDPKPDGSCNSGFHGNFMNWATSSAIDILRMGLTGGNRVTDTNNATVLQRAYLPDTFYAAKNFPFFNPFPEKKISKAMAQKMVPGVASGLGGSDDLYVYNCRDRVYFAKSQDLDGTCAEPFKVANAGSSELIGPGGGGTNKFYPVNVQVCDNANTQKARRMRYNADTKKWTGLCLPYGTVWKPVGQLQVNADDVQVAVFGYLQDNSDARYGGVLRAPMKYLGPNKFDSSFNLETANNPYREWDDTGAFITDPHKLHPDYGNQGYASSGAVNYINKFGTLNPASLGKYKENDPLSELYYETIRYLQGKQPTPEAVTGFTDTVAGDKTLKENFPAYATWTDPFIGFTDSTANATTCLKNSVLAIADTSTHSDRSVPGNTNILFRDFARVGRAADDNPTLDAPFWTSVVGSFESQTTATASVTYRDSLNRLQTAGNLVSNTRYPALAAAATMEAGNISPTEGGGSHYIAGIAYWAHTQSFRPSLPKARVTTYGMDVNQNGLSGNDSVRRQSQLHLAAKYGGFNDAAAGNTGNPYAPGSNVLWQASDGDAKNHFLVNDAAKFLDGLSDVFSRVVAETGAISGGAISTQRLTSSSTASVFQARYNPVAEFWSGRVFKFPLSLSPDQTSVVIGSTATWEAGQLLTNFAKNDGLGVPSRNIVIGPPPGRLGIDAATPFKWADLVTTHKDALNKLPDLNGTVDTLGERRLNYLRGDQRDEDTAMTPDGIFRPRDMVLGDIVNSGLVYLDKPSASIPGAAFRAFYDANKNRRPVIFANANDGMLHAFYDDTGAEAFAYIPGFLASKLNRLPSQDYKHISLADGTPAVAEVYFGSRSAWGTALVSGVGGGAQGVYALDVSNPATFNKDKVLWEFTDSDHPAMGNVLGTPQILKFRVQTAPAANPTYKYYAVVASGVNNYAPDGKAYASGNPSLFFLDMDFVPSATSKWVEGTNFWRIELPQASETMAKGLVGFNSLLDFDSRSVDALYAGDLQGNLWKLDFTSSGVTSLVANAETNFQTFNRLANDKPLFVAKAVAGGTALQPITGSPEIVNSYFGKKLITFGTGKFLETSDMTVPLATTASFYAVQDDNAPIADRASLKAGSISTAGTVTIPAFTLGTPVTTTVKAGWYVDLNASIAERQVSDISAISGKLVFGSIYPTRGSCGEGGGRLYVVDALTGNGSSEDSEVGVLSAPLVLNVGAVALTLSDTTGQRTATERFAVLTQGTKGLKTSNISGSYSYQTGRLSWRQINNYRKAD